MAFMPPENVQTNVSADAAEEFLTKYYRALNRDRSTLDSFYIHPTPSSPLTADISLNGNVIFMPSDLQAFLTREPSPSHYEVQAFDCQVLNLNYNIGVEADNDLVPQKDGRKMSFLVIVSGYVKYDDTKPDDMKGFTETFVLVPNFEARGPEKGRARGSGGQKKWLIQSQNFRLVS